jgi:8-oxo-dGTP pyrophosphatase MutT (NUDIX family)
VNTSINTELPAAIAAEKSRFTPRVTVATIVAHPDDTALPLKLRRFLYVEEWIGDTRQLNQPAGHLDPNESLLEAAVRETLEETAWQVALEHVVAVYQYQTLERAFVRFTFAAKAIAHTGAALDVGIIQALWLTRDELTLHPSSMRSPMVLQGLDHYLAGARHSLDVLRALA